MFKPPFILSIAGGGSTYTPGIVKSLMVRLQDFRWRRFASTTSMKHARAPLRRWSRR